MEMHVNVYYIYINKLYICILYLYGPPLQYPPNVRVFTVNYSVLVICWEHFLSDIGTFFHMIV